MEKKEFQLTSWIDRLTMALTPTMLTEHSPREQTSRFTVQYVEGRHSVIVSYNVCTVKISIDQCCGYQVSQSTVVAGIVPILNGCPPSWKGKSTHLKWRLCRGQSLPRFLWSVSFLSVFYSYCTSVRALVRWRDKIVKNSEELDMALFPRCTKIVFSVCVWIYVCGCVQIDSQ